MSNRINYANWSAALVDFCLECQQASVIAGVKHPTGRKLTPDEATIDYLVTALLSDDKDMDSLDKICGHYGISRGVLWAWIKRDATRYQMYLDASRAKIQFRNERVIDKLWIIAERVPESDPTFSELIRALDSLAKAQGLTKETVTIHATINRAPSDLTDDELVDIIAGRSERTSEPPPSADAPSRVH